MPLLTGFLLVLIAALLQGTFILPMTFVKRWSWEHTWATFSLLGMFVFNWVISLALVPDIFHVYRISPSQDLLLLALFGAGWGVGAILFGLGMDELGMALGYPVIMGLIAALGSLIPLLVFFPQALLTSKGLVLLIGTALVICGIVLCSMAGSRKAPSTSAVQGSTFRTGLIICILAGVLSCLPNVGVAFGDTVALAAKALGIPGSAVVNVIWALLFTAGFVVNFAYCLYLMIARGTASAFWGPETGRNLGLSASMAVMWIASFYLYGAGAARLGRWGVIIGWPLFISLSIVVGNVWGLWRGEWKGASPDSRRLLNQGLFVLILAVVTVAFSNRF